MNQNNQTPAPQGRGPMIPHLSVIIGVLSMVIGIMCLLKAHEILINVLWCLVGLVLIYYGMVTLHIDNALGNVVNFFKRLMQSLRG